MLPHKKSDQSFISVPVTRVGSVQRLNQLSNSSNIYTSNPTTPVTYVSSSLNPNKNNTASWNTHDSKIKTKEQVELFERLLVVEKVSEFERILTYLSTAISSFKDDDISQYVDDLIMVNDTISTEIKKLQGHRELNRRIKNLKQEKLDLDQESRSILKELIQYRSDLKQLPKVSAVKSSKKGDKSFNSIDVEDSLKYAMKLSKFTKAPAITSNAPFQIHPNNYVWPAEDALRRGMLALASLKSDEIVKSELEAYESDDIKGKEQISTKESGEGKHDESPSRNRKGSFGSYSEIPKTENVPELQPQTTSNALDLDLFDPDEDDDSD